MGLKVKTVLHGHVAMAELVDRTFGPNAHGGIAGLRKRRAVIHVYDHEFGEKQEIRVWDPEGKNYPVGRQVAVTVQVLDEQVDEIGAL